MNKKNGLRDQIMKKIFKIFKIQVYERIWKREKIHLKNSWNTTYTAQFELVISIIITVNLNHPICTKNTCTTQFKGNIGPWKKILNQNFFGFQNMKKKLGQLYKKHLATRKKIFEKSCFLL